MKKIIVWKKKDNLYYYKIVSGFYKDYFIGYKNQYDHEVILIIDIYKDILCKTPLIKKVIRKLISLLHKLEKKL